MNALLALGGIAVLAACLAAVAAGGVAARAWRHDAPRVLVCAIGILGALAAAGPRLAALAGAMPAAAGWPAWLRLVTEGALALVFLALLQAWRRQDRDARRHAAAAASGSATGLPKRPGFVALMVPALARCRREGAPAAILALALPDLAEVERRRGPATARDALRDLAAVLRDTARAGDLPGHLAPEALAVFLPGTSAEAAQALAARLAAEVAARLPSPAMDGTRMRVALAIAPVGEGAGTAVLDEALDAAAAALARAVAEGMVVTALPAPSRSAAAPG